MKIFGLLPFLLIIPLIPGRSYLIFGIRNFASAFNGPPQNLNYLIEYSRSAFFSIMSLF